MIRALLVLLSIVFPLATGFAGMVGITLFFPDAHIDTQGWLIAWIGLAIGLCAGIACVWIFWRRRAGGR